jgi:hypothetical protein
VSVPVPLGAQIKIAPVKSDVIVLSPLIVSVHLVIAMDWVPRPGIGNEQLWFASAVAVNPSTEQFTMQ